MPLTLKDLFARLRQETKPQCTLLGIGPMSREVIRAAVRAARDGDFPLLLIASRNQVDLEALGGGYIGGGLDQFAFARLVRETAASEGFSGPIFLCRDHGGPWQRDEEYRSKCSLIAAMDTAKRSYEADLKAGFNLLHIDPTKDPHIDGPLPLPVVLDRTIELIEFAEKCAEKLNLTEPVSYEVGTEETAGGLTGDDAFRVFLHDLTQRLSGLGLPTPDLIVGQTGTLVRMGTNVGRVDGPKARNLELIARSFGLGLKEHNADYLHEAVLAVHPGLGITAANVAPEFGEVQTLAYLELAKIEQDMMAGAKRAPSNMADRLQEEVLASGRWRKWLAGDASGWSEEDLLQSDGLGKIISGCGHYAFSTASFAQERDTMFANLQSMGLEVDPEEIVITAIQTAVCRYADSFRLPGLTTRLQKRNLGS